MDNLCPCTWILQITHCHYYTNYHYTDMVNVKCGQLNDGQLWLDRYRVLKLGVCLRCILNCRADVKSMLSKCTWWESTWINYLTAIFVERGNKQTAASLQSDTHGAWNSIPLIWVAHIYVRCCLFQTHNWGRICHLSHQIEPVLYCISAASGF